MGDNKLEEGALYLFQGAPPVLLRTNKSHAFNRVIFFCIFVMCEVATKIVGYSTFYRGTTEQYFRKYNILIIYFHVIPKYHLESWI